VCPTVEYTVWGPATPRGKLTYPPGRRGGGPRGGPAGPLPSFFSETTFVEVPHTHLTPVFLIKLSHIVLETLTCLRL
jgi:hypothetical protein